MATEDAEPPLVDVPMPSLQPGKGFPEWVWKDIERYLQRYERGRLRRERETPEQRRKRLEYGRQWRARKKRAAAGEPANSPV